MMLKIFSAVLLAGYVVAVDYHDTLDDDIIFEKLNIEQIKDFLYCILDKQKCTDVAASYKKHYPAVVVEECARCSARQKHMLRVFLDRLGAERPADLRLYRDRFDPQGEHYDRLYQNIAKY